MLNFYAQLSKRIKHFIPRQSFFFNGRTFLVNGRPFFITGGKHFSKRHKHFIIEPTFIAIQGVLG